jgi:hypothetical protein
MSSEKASSPQAWTCLLETAKKARECGHWGLAALSMGQEAESGHLISYRVANGIQESLRENEILP